MSDRETEILVKPSIDQQELNKTLAGLDALREKVKQARAENQQIIEASQVTLGERIAGGIDDSINGLKRLSDGAKNFGSNLASGAQSAFATINQKVSEFGKNLNDAIEKNIKNAAKIGAALIGGFAATSFAFANRQGGVDPQATAQNRAQAELQRALEDLGAVASRFVTPALDGLARAVELVSKFLDAAFPSGGKNPVQQFVNEAIPNAIKALIDLSGLFRVAVEAGKTFVNEGLDYLATVTRSIATGLQDTFGKLFNSLLELIAGVVDKVSFLIPDAGKLAAGLRLSKDQSAIPGQDGQTTYQRFIQDEGLRFANKFKQSSDELGKSVATIATQTDAAKKSFDGLANAISGLNLTPRIGKQEVDAFIRRNQDIAKADKALTDGETAARKQANDQLLKLEQKYTQDRTKQLAENAQTESDLVQKYNDEKLKDAESFAQNELQIQADAQAKREQDLRAHQLTLRELASRGDVAGFVEEQRRFALQNQNDDETAARDKAKRSQEFQRTQAEKDRQFGIDLAKLQEQGAARLAELDTQYTQQQDEINTALTEQLNALQKFHDDQITEIDRAFAQQLSALSSNLAGLNDMQNAYYAAESANLAAFISTQKGYLQDLYNSTYASAGGVPGAIDTGGLSQVSQGVSVTFESGAIQNTVGDVATQSQLEAVQNTMTAGVAAALFGTGQIQFAPAARENF